MALEKKSDYPAGLRLWHWLNFFAISVMLITVLLRKTFLAYRSNSALIQEKSLAAGTPVTKAIADEIAKTMRDRMWDWHVYFGFVLAALLVWRLIMKVRGVSSLSAERFAANERRAQRVGYLIFYSYAAFLSVTGLTLAFKTSLPFSKDILGFIKEAHELALWGMLVFVPMHLVGVIAAEFKTRSKGLISRMIGS